MNINHNVVKGIIKDINHRSTNRLHGQIMSLTDQVADLEAEVVELRKYKEMWNDPAKLQVNLISEQKLSQENALHIAGATDYFLLKRNNVLFNILNRALIQGKWRFAHTDHKWIVAFDVNDPHVMVHCDNLIQLATSGAFSNTVRDLATLDERAILRKYEWFGFEME